ncbi:tannase/feruloyl esterase family alpha/beta hydrolase [Pantoea sp. App145]|uniref:tannase/feruloyl esterase family alpha/beta hydrolase n=1 Tax=Pantoea sp. App145 TaxID=3071567 RepID=UPI003A8118E9
MHKNRIPMKPYPSRSVVSLAIILSGLSFSSLAQANTISPPQPVPVASTPGVVACNDLMKLAIPDTTIDNTEYLRGSFTPASKNADVLRGGTTNTINGLPEFCRVSLTIKPSIKVEVWLPATNWNHRFQAEGNGGYAGFIVYDAMGRALKQGYATASTDTGHEGSQLNGKFVLNADNSLNHGAVNDFAWRAVHEMTVKSKAIIHAYYQKPISFSYWNGCSTGGRQGLMEAQRFPHDYDGIYAGAPAINWDRFIVAELWPKLVMQKELGSSISNEKLSKLNAAIVATYDQQDGVKDGVISDPFKISVDDAVFKSAGFSAQEMAVVRKIWAGPTTPEGRQLWYGLEPGAPFTLATMAFPISTDYLGSWLQNNPEWDWKSLNYKEYTDLFSLSKQIFAPIIATDNLQLNTFKASGGKLLIWHGLSDQLIFPKGTIEYYKNLISTMGGMESTQSFARLYLAPGVEHCRGGEGPNSIQGMDALVKWVEKNKVPQEVMAQKIVKNKVIRTLPLCAWPKRTIYLGKGNINEAESYACK